jgi:hypothetical protein
VNAHEFAALLTHGFADALHVVVENEPRFGRSGTACGRRWTRWNGTSRLAGRSGDKYPAQTGERRRVS